MEFNIHQVKMVQKNIRWNISKEKGAKIAHDTIIDILSESKNNKLLLSELIVLLNQRTKKIKLTNHRKNKQFSFYIKTVYGSMTDFLDNYSFYGLTFDKSRIYVSLIDTELIKTNLTPSIISEYREWTMVDTEDFEFV